jgi:hypothetical protein
MLSFSSVKDFNGPEDASRDPLVFSVSAIEVHSKVSDEPVGASYAPDQ